MKSHQQLVKEYRAKMIEICRERGLHLGYTNTTVNILCDVLKKGMDAAAKGAAEASKLEWDENPKDDADYGWNTAIQKSEHQLKDYFKEV